LGRITLFEIKLLQIRYFDFPNSPLTPLGKNQKKQIKISLQKIIRKKMTSPLRSAPSVHTTADICKGLATFSFAIVTENVRYQQTLYDISSWDVKKLRRS